MQKEIFIIRANHVVPERASQLLYGLCDLSANVLNDSPSEFITFCISLLLA